MRYVLLHAHHVTGKETGKHNGEVETQELHSLFPFLQYQKLSLAETEKFQW